MRESTGAHHVVVVGGGFGGLYTTLHLEKKLSRSSNVEVTLVNRENFFLFTPMLHEVATGSVTNFYNLPGLAENALTIKLQNRRAIQRPAFPQHERKIDHD